MWILAPAVLALACGDSSGDASDLGNGAGADAGRGDSGGMVADMGSGQPDAGPLRPEFAPDISLQDQNPTSPRTGEGVSPKDYLSMVSGWYFTHAT